MVSPKGDVARRMLRPMNRLNAEGKKESITRDLEMDPSVK